MSPDLSPLSLLCLLGALQGLLLAIAIGSMRGGLPRANRFLALIFLASTAVLVVILLSHRPNAGRASGAVLIDLEFVEYSLWMFAGPVTLLYVALVRARDAWPSRGFALHFAPAGLWLAYSAVSLGLLSSPPSLPPVHWMMLYQMAYTAAALHLWLRSPLRSEAWKRPSSLGLHSLAVPALLGVLAVQHAAQLVRWLFPQQAALRDIVPLAGAASFVVVTLIGLRKALPNLGALGRRYAGSTLTAERAEALAKRLEEFMMRDKPYLETDLTLEGLAAALGAPKTHVSQVLNESLGRSFLEYLAAYRVTESTRLLRDEGSKHLTIEAIARRSGFKSRSAFYEAFRRHHGGTPAEFRRQSAAD